MFLLCVCADVDLDAVVPSSEKLSHPTALRPRVTDRRPRSQIITPVSVFVVKCGASDHQRTSESSFCLSLAVFPVQHRPGSACSGGEEGQGQREGGAGVCVQICRRLPEERSPHHLCTTTFTTPPCTVYFLQQGAAHHRHS